MLDAQTFLQPQSVPHTKHSLLILFILLQRVHHGVTHRLTSTVLYYIQWNLWVTFSFPVFTSPVLVPITAKHVNCRYSIIWHAQNQEPGARHVFHSMLSAQPIWHYRKLQTPAPQIRHVPLSRTASRCLEQGKAQAHEPRVRRWIPRKLILRVGSTCFWLRPKGTFL